MNNKISYYNIYYKNKRIKYLKLKKTINRIKIIKNYFEKLFIPKILKI